MKRKVIFNMAILLVVFITPTQAMAQPKVSSKAAILMDIKTGQILFQKNADQKMYPASTTKILTTLVAIKKGNLNDDVLISHKAASTKESSVGFQEGETVKLGDLLYAMMLSSANDAAMAVAEHIGGSQEGFAQLMNSEAQSIGAKNSHFVTPHGLHDPQHYTTAKDLAMITREAMKNSLFRKYASTYSYHISRTLPRSVKGIPQEDFVNFNKLIWPKSIYSYPGANGVKTGFTDEAGSCLVSSAQRDGPEFLTVVMKTDRNGIFRDSVTLLDYGFNEFKSLQLVKKGERLGVANVKEGDTDMIRALADEDYNYNVPITDKPDIKKKIQLDKEVEAPVIKGQKIGTVTFLMDGKEIKRTDLVSDRNVEQRPSFSWWYGAVFASFLLISIRSMVGARVKRRRYYYKRRRYH